MTAGKFLAPPAQQITHSVRSGFRGRGGGSDPDFVSLCTVRSECFCAMAWPSVDSWQAGQPVCPRSAE
eukprot:9407039-Alexandrium_andersonii.AAC.1